MMLCLEGKSDPPTDNVGFPRKFLFPQGFLVPSGNEVSFLKGTRFFPRKKKAVQE